MTRKWGSCSTAGTVTLAIDLDEELEAFQDFVIAHELLHLKVPNHGKLFKALMTAHIPEWCEHDVYRRTVCKGCLREDAKGNNRTVAFLDRQP
jgi:predicted metal-dependent hydrolase